MKEVREWELREYLIEIIRYKDKKGLYEGNLFKNESFYVKVDDFNSVELAHGRTVFLPDRDNPGEFIARKLSLK